MDFHGAQVQLTGTILQNGHLNATDTLRETRTDMGCNGIKFRIMLIKKVTPDRAIYCS